MGDGAGNAGFKTIRPNGDAKTKGILGLPIWSHVNDDNDSTFSRPSDGQQWPNTYCILNFTDISAPLSSQRFYQLRMRSRVQLHSSDPGHGATIDAKFRSSISGDLGGYTRFFTANQLGGVTSAVTLTGPWVAKHPSNVEWNWPSINNIQAYLVWYMSVGSVHTNLRLLEFYVDVDIRDQPTVTGVTVTGNTTSTRPTITWTYNPNVDGDAQFWYHVKVFNSTQYGASDFDAETSTAVWNSGQLAGDSETIIVEKDLSLSTNYKAFVKAAQRFHGVPWFSEWAESSSFTLTPVIPPTPTLTLTADSTVPYLRNKLTVTQNLNMLTANQSTLEDGVTTGWEVNALCTLAATTSTAADGQYSLQVTSTGSGTMRAQTLDGLDAVPVSPSTQYTAIAFVRTATTGRSCLASIRWYDKTGTIIGSPSNGTASNDTTTFAQRSVTATSPSTARYAAVAVEWASTVTSEVHYADHVDLHTGSSINFCPAEAYTLIETAWVTNGEANLAHPQLFSGGEDEKNANGFFASGTSSTAVYDTSDSFHGVGSIRWNVEDTNSKLYIGWPSGTDTNPDPIYPLAAVPGRAYSFSVRLKADASFTSQVNLQAIDKDGTSKGSAANGGGITITTSWQEFKVQNFTVPTDGVWVKPFLDNTTSGRKVWVDAVRWYQASTVPAALESSTSGLPTVWTPVRGADEGDLAPATGDSKVYVHDLEVPPGYSVVYRARNVSPATELLPVALASDVTPYIMTMMDPPGVSVLSLPGDGRLRTQVRVTDYPQTRHEESETYFPLRPGAYSFPVVTSDFLGARDGTITIKTKTEDEWRALEDLLRLPQTLWLVHPDFGARYIRITERSWDVKQLDKNMTWLRTVTLPVLEVDRPVT